VIDGQTDEQNYDPQDRASIAASRGKNEPGTNAILCSLDLRTDSTGPENALGGCLSYVG